MSRIHIVHIQFLSEKSNRELLISRKLWEQWGWQKKTINVEFGHRSITASVVLIDSNELEIFLPVKVKEELMIPITCQLKSRFNNGTLRLGPIVGILMAGSSNTNLYEYLVSELEKEPLCLFLFTPHDIHWPSKMVTGSFLETTFDSKKSWRQYQIPFPDVVYNRIYGRENEQTNAFHTFKKNIELYTQAKMFNPSFFSKDMVYQHLILHPDIKQYIPETRIAPSISDIQDFLIKYQTIYLKPVTGSLGYGIFKISFDEGTGYICRYRENLQEVQQIFRSLDELIEFHFKNGLLSIYLLQQAINLAGMDNQYFDFRIHLSKDGNNHWNSVVLAPFLTNKKNITTHSGAYTSRSVLQEVFGNQCIELTKKISEVAINAALTLESSLNQPLGELGIDMGIDSSGHIWIFEINSKPSHIIIIDESLKNEFLHSIRLLSEYLQYMAGFRS